MAAREKSAAIQSAHCKLSPASLLDAVAPSISFRTVASAGQIYKNTHTKAISTQLCLQRIYTLSSQMVLHHIFWLDRDRGEVAAPLSPPAILVGAHPPLEFTSAPPSKQMLRRTCWFCEHSELVRRTNAQTRAEAQITFSVVRVSCNLYRIGIGVRSPATPSLS